MNRDDFEPRVLELWMKSRIPLTKAHIQYYTGVSRRQINRWLDELAVDGVVEVDVDDSGEMVWTVPGAARPVDGPRSFADLERREVVRNEARRNARRRAGKGALLDDPAVTTAAAMSKNALALTNRALGSLDKPRSEGDKSLALSAGLSFFGPLGWLYAGSFREAVPAALVALVVAKIVPTFLLMPLLFVLMPASAVAGLIYAWQHNRLGHRTTLFLDDPKDRSK